MVSRFRWSQRGSSQMWQRGSFTFQNRSRQTLVDVTAQRWHQIPRQGVVTIFGKSPGIRLRQPQASPQVCQSDKRLHLCHGASNSNPKFSWTQCCWDCQLLRFRLGRTSKIKEINQRFIDHSVLALFQSLCNKRQLSRKDKFDKLSGMFPALVVAAFWAQNFA